MTHFISNLRGKRNCLNILHLNYHVKIQYMYMITVQNGSFLLIKCFWPVILNLNSSGQRSISGKGLKDYRMPNSGALHFL